MDWCAAQCRSDGRGLCLDAAGVDARQVGVARGSARGAQAVRRFLLDQQLLGRRGRCHRGSAGSRRVWAHEAPAVPRNGNFAGRRRRGSFQQPAVRKRFFLPSRRGGNAFLASP